MSGLARCSRSPVNRVAKKTVDHGPRVYGPVPSRRLGSSLGVDLVPRKTCDFDCVYCQLGRTTTITTRRQPWISADDVLKELLPVLESGTRPDYVTMAGSGEPTLNTELAEIITRVREVSDVPVAVLTNGSLLWDPDVAAACALADLVLPSLDAGDEETFRKVNRPYPGLRLEQVVSGLVDFRKRYDGNIWLEVMMVEGFNSSEEDVKRIGELLGEIAPDEVHLNTVARPPAERAARPVTEDTLSETASLLRPHVTVLEEVMRGEGGIPDGSIDENRLLDLLSRRPCTRRDIAVAFDTNEIEALKVLSRLVSDNAVVSESSRGEVYYRVLPPRR